MTTVLAFTVTLTILAFTVTLAVLVAFRNFKAYRNEIERRERFLNFFVSQKVIDDVLRGCAKVLHERFLLEQNRQRDSKINNVDEYTDALAFSQEEMVASKKIFWKKVAIARAEGYKVPTSYKDLLVKPDEKSLPASGGESKS